jgi:energy-coupling factor transport system permease protein
MPSLALNVQARPTALGDVDVRVKFALLLSTSFLIFVWNSIALQTATLAAMLSLLLSAAVRPREIAGLVFMLWPAFALIVVIQGLWSPLGQTPVWHLPDGLPWLGGAAFFRWEGIAFGLTVCCRLLIPLLAFLFLFATSSPNTIVLGLVRMRVPYRVAFLVSTTFRFVPLLLEELSAMRDAQRLRGIDVDAMSIPRKLILTGRMLVPLIVASLRRAQQIEVALQSRGFSGSEKRTYLDAGRMRLRAGEWLAIVLLLALPPVATLLRAATGLGSAVI